MSISGGWFIKLSNEFVFPDVESPIINICMDHIEFMANLG